MSVDKWTNRARRDNFRLPSVFFLSISSVKKFELDFQSTDPRMPTRGLACTVLVRDCRRRLVISERDAISITQSVFTHSPSTTHTHTQTDRQTHTGREKVAAAVLYLSTTVSLSKNTPFVVIANVSETFYSAAASGHSRRAFSTRLPLVLLDNTVHDVDMQTPHRIQSKPWRPHIGANGIS